MRRFLASCVIGLGSFAATSSVFAAGSADLQVQIQAPTTVNISTATNYTVVVKNNGPVTATNVGLTVDFPLTATSPQVYILGTVSENDARCNIVNRRLTCALGSIKKNKTATVVYSYTAPVSTRVLTMTATVSGSENDPVSGNNTASVAPNLTYPVRAISTASGATTNVQTSLCTGTNLSSFFECELFPSSIQSHVATLHGNGSVTFSEPGYYGSWSQSASQKDLRIEYFDVGGKVAEFNGFAINGQQCFDGLTIFFPASTYVSPYRICLQ